MKYSRDLTVLVENLASNFGSLPTKSKLGCPVEMGGEEGDQSKWGASMGGDKMELIAKLAKASNLGGSKLTGVGGGALMAPQAALGGNKE